MSLAIDVDGVWAVLLPDGWHECAPSATSDDVSSFDVDAYAFVRGERMLLGGGSCAGVPSGGAAWTEPDGTFMRVPLTSVLAVASQVPFRHHGIRWVPGGA